MPRIARIVMKNAPHHITQRGNYNHKVFNDNNDRICYLKLIKKYSKKYYLKILAYCLMNNHVHFIVIPENKDSMAKTFHVVGMQYAQYINRKRKLAGHLWQSRFYSCFMDERHTYIATRYVEQNPVKAKMVNEAWQWKWSSAGYHIGGKDIAGFLEHATFLPEPNEWRNELKSQVSEPIIDRLEWCTKSGRPFAELPIIKKLEEITKTRLKYRRVGRPKKSKN